MRQPKRPPLAIKTVNRAALALGKQLARRGATIRKIAAKVKNSEGKSIHHSLIGRYAAGEGLPSFGWRRAIEKSLSIKTDWWDQV
jgi:diadenosine tetraphosphate (Ap4A) HIT family hydrolase